MAAEYGLLSLTHLQKLAQSLQAQPLNPSSTTTSSTGMWNPNTIQPSQEEEDESWEVRAFAEDTNHAMGTTWPPRSYTCTFCRREFRSAQALGGHMNVHRRDRARLHQTQPPVATLKNPPTTSSTAAPSNALIIPTREFATNGGLCLLYSLPNPNNVCTMDSPSTLLSISPYPPNHLIPPCAPSINFPAAATRSVNSTLCHSSNTDPSAASVHNDNNRNNDSSAIEELDLELRLGQS